MGKLPNRSSFLADWDKSTTELCCGAVKGLKKCKAASAINRNQEKVKQRRHDNSMRVLCVIRRHIWRTPRKGMIPNETAGVIQVICTTLPRQHKQFMQTRIKKPITVLFVCTYVCICFVRSDEVLAVSRLLN